MKGDLHCHSTFSDGTSTPSEIVLLAKAKGFDLVTVTDHDTVGGFDELKQAALKENLKYISGIEISSFYEDHPVHILGYSFNPLSPSMIDYEESSRDKRYKRALQMIQKLQELGMNITEAELDPFVRTGKTIGRVHIARLLVEKKYGDSIPEVFRYFLKEGKPAYVPHEKLTIEESIALIHQAGGRASLAHPHLIHKSVAQKILDRYSFDAVEVFYCRFPEKETNFWFEYAKKKGLWATGGSDFHGHVREHAPYGIAYTPEETSLFLWNVMSQHKV